ncbi:cyanoexosortase A [Iningainema tapete]|uniref:Cyanoexosortase A n=1 Tax=Iningainema tapete BLCC-T55 TaxID=2748662 RepID=A0A8J7BX61_9CYAN|nr:cyanoexosortase A [Iningainema tapete]MBD2773132.1 cyanoexosortase A [Iningainema tapete BLCC-T55]
MKEFQLTQLLSWKDPRYWLLAIAIALETMCITLVWRADDMGHLGMSILFLLATSTLLWEKRHSLSFESDFFSSLVGVVLISWVLWESINLSAGHALRLLSLTSAIGVALLASGFKGLKQYWQELIILFFLGVPGVIAAFLFDLSPLSAKFGGFLLSLSGFSVSVVGTNINLPTGGVRVVYGCSGIDTITYVLGIAVIALVMFPVHWRKQIFVPIVAIAIGFIVNGVRIAMLAAMSVSNKAAFDDWHGGTASYSFGMIGIFLLGLFYWFLLEQEGNIKKS